MKHWALDDNMTKENYLLSIKTGAFIRTIESWIMKVVTLVEHMHTERLQIEAGPKSIMDT